MHTKTILAALVSAAAVQAAALPDAPVGEKAADCVASKKLADGIDKNIALQKMEQQAVGEVKKLLSADGQIDQAKFAEAKKVLVGYVNDGIKVREENQKAAQPGNPAIPGLATVANAQKSELQQAEGLKGTKADLAVVAQLEKEFAGGIEQNQKNKLAAMTGC
ncbi:hypothetical protein MAPG_04268 [Magnaporthiopsis poae ATCC 64411]|uniref:Cell wall protein n=1 Tax=Magnaporthiopsis poae (strain ATCC 64411 / 73-15) TaxID=644358 RepID=A0A0C4DW94_MAGP6|nr:hypothetical protein MAPG_04268 [Magnaporthiopsis poae ATCC 64411]